MSNVGQAALTIVGTVVGAYFGYPQLGFVLGSLAGQALFPTQLPTINGPKLTDTRTTTSMVGAPVMEVLGMDAVPGTVMWLGPVDETSSTNTTGGKGGPQQDVKSFSYFQPIAIGLCRGTMGGLLKVFENGKLVYDLTQQRDDETDAQYVQRGLANNVYAENFTLYLGTEDQLPDPIIEGFEGVGNVPAFRGLMYIVFHNRHLRDDQGLRHPNFKFVVFQVGLTDCEEVTEAAQETMHFWLDSEDPINSFNGHTWQLTSSGNGTAGAGGDCAHAGFYSSRELALNAMGADKGFAMAYFQGQATGLVVPPHGQQFSYTDTMGAPRAHNEKEIALFYSHTTAEIAVAASNVIAGCIAGGSTPRSFKPVSMNTFAGSGTGSEHCIAMYGDENPTGPPGWQVATADGMDRWIISTYSGCILVQRRPVAPPNPCLLLPPYPGADGYCYRGTEVIEGSDWVRVDASCLVLQKWINTTIVELPVGPAMLTSDEDNTEEFWTAHYEAAVAFGFMEPGLDYPADYPATQDFYYQRTFNICSAVADGITLDKVVRHICLRCGLTDEQIDVTDLETTEIGGYVLSRIMNGRDAIEPLRLVGYFDVVESGDILKFVKRGKAAVRTLSESDLGAYEYGTDAPPAVTTIKQQDTDLPRQLRLHYRALSRDYEDGEQLSPTRLTTLATNDVDVECPIAITDQMAAEAAEVNWADPWAGRWVHQTQLDRGQLELEPSDCILVPVDGRLERLRIVAIDDQLPTVRKVEAVRDDGNSYVSVALSDDPVRPPAVMVLYTPTVVILMDLPPLRDEDEDAGLYAAAVPEFAGGTWAGAQIFRSLDDGGSYQQVAGISGQATTGTISAELPAADPNVWDDENALLVTLETGSLETRTEADVLLGANAVAIGANGRWEIVQFVTATQVGPFAWSLTKLLRGRRGTEHNMGLPEVGDRFVLVSGPSIVRLALPASFVGEAVLYRGVTVGALTTSATDTSYASAGVTLLPFSPAMLDAVREDDDDVVLTWLRRDRHGQELQSGEDVPMSEAALAFKVEFFEVGETVAARTVLVSVETITYSAADQATDLGGLVPFVVHVSQISTTVGAGTPAVATFDV